MSHNLTAKYRPQRFQDVAGQQAVCTVLSRAAAGGRVAPAYLFSGTRGVGKTTLARIFAKAVNCLKGPAAEPCNTCPICRQITKGCCVDVTEMDGASSRKIDDIRRLKEEVGFAPMECRFKVFIIDEAHMLTREAFNALLKTLEEPPEHATFILATTEPQKLPQTIVSRCQHYVFKHLPPKTIKDHLAEILKKEDIKAEPGVLGLIARRAAGSVRDGMSLLSQMLAFADNELRQDQVREILGLAGQELLQNVVKAIRDQDAVRLSSLADTLLQQGLDMGFFLRELVQSWRNMFLLLQCGDQGASLLELPESEIAVWQDIAASFTLPHVHACWQVCLEGQRRVLACPDPGTALEMLLLNLAFLPAMLPIEQAPPSSNPGTLKHEPARKSEALKKSVSNPNTAQESKPEKQAEEPKKNDNVQPTPSAEDPKSFNRFLDLVRERKGENGLFAALSRASLTVQDRQLVLSCPSSTQEKILNTPEAARDIRALVKEHYGPQWSITVQKRPARPVRVNRRQAVEEAKRLPQIQRVLNEFDARIVDAVPVKEKFDKKA